jgi:spore germination protein YaaH
MKKAVACLSLGVLFWMIPAGAFAAALKYAVWVPYWKKTAGVAETKANLKKLAEISPFSYTVNRRGELADTAKLSVEPWPDLFAAAKTQGVKVLPAVLWNDSAAIDAVLSASSSRAAHSKKILALIETGGFDGIDIDYENKFASTSPYFTIFLRDLGKDLHAKGKVLSCTIEARTPPASRYLVVPKKLEYANDYKALNKYCDQVRLMTYDQGAIDIKLNMARRLGGYYYPIADPTWVRKVLDLAVKDISPKKIMLGVATYGYELEVTDKRKFFDYRQVRSLSFRDLKTLAQTAGRQPVRDNAGELALVFAREGQTRFATFSDAKAIAGKIAIARLYGLRGVAVFKVDGESDNYWPYLK